MKFTVNANSKSHVAWIRYQESISIENRSGVSSFYIIDVIRSEIVLAGAIVITEEQVSILWYHRNARARALLRVCVCVCVCVCVRAWSFDRNRNCLFFQLFRTTTNSFIRTIDSFEKQTFIKTSRAFQRDFTLFTSSCKLLSDYLTV